MMAFSVDQALARERAKRIAKAERAAGIRDGASYRARQPDGTFTWHRVHLRFYPAERWFVEDLKGMAEPTPVPDTYRPLDDDLKNKLESWL